MNAMKKLFWYLCLVGVLSAALLGATVYSILIMFSAATELAAEGVDRLMDSVMGVYFRLEIKLN